VVSDGHCRISNDPMIECIDLGDQYVSDFVGADEITSGYKSRLKFGYGPTSRLLQLFGSVPPEDLYRRYWYRSGINEAMRNELKSIVDSARTFVRLKPGDTVLDIASNDGTLLAAYPEDLNRVGIDPSNVARESEFYEASSVSLVNDFFSAEAFRTVSAAQAKIITVIAMFYDLNEPLAFLEDVRKVIAEDGVFVLQLAYTPLSLDQNEFGNFAHEHVCYYTLGVLADLLEKSDFEIFDTQLNDANGGSIRVYAAPKGAVRKLACPLNMLSIGETRTVSLLEYEKVKEVDSRETYDRFVKRIDRLKNQTISWLQKQSADGKRVIGYGASTKGNVLLQYYGITPDLLPYIAERSEEKVGLYTIGTGIPIISEDEMRKRKPDYLFALPWFFINSFLDREKELLAGGTRFVVPQPELRVIE
jgi:hypothetical protein